MDKKETGSEEILFEGVLVPDPNADEEMSDIEQLADEEIRGSRILIVKRAIQAVDFDGTAGGIIQLSCEFHPSHGTRFTWARVAITLTTPEGINFISVQPDLVQEKMPVVFQYNKGGKLSLGIPEYAGAEISGERQKQFTVFHNTVRGSGDGTKKALWTFEENDQTRQGLGQKNILTVTVPATGAIGGQLTVNCRVSRKGIKGLADKLRDLVLAGPEIAPSSMVFTIPTVPVSTGSGILNEFFKFLK
jgi:hypothetical protein